ncbi:hypothetical protein BDN72DRAFT_323012 [Pluteus cervinus]|uniref:Uncharacterized protein n=1 Tax=Pluteus cervinus TaxID=181527 RepID=A0ACD3ADJ0_9AGAR|nr:hypothetical protein BDN72DRAFT_323012 [Pluteus cervinus]
MIIKGVERGHCMMTRTSLPKGRECLRKEWKGRKKLVGEILGRARLIYAGGGVWSYFVALWKTVIDGQRHHPPLLNSS